jgi:hypothetical protein
MKCKELGLPCPKCGSTYTITYDVMVGFWQSVCKKCTWMWAQEIGKIKKKKKSKDKT